MIITLPLKTLAKIERLLSDTKHLHYAMNQHSLVINCPRMKKLSNQQLQRLYIGHKLEIRLKEGEHGKIHMLMRVLLLLVLTTRHTYSLPLNK